MSLADPATAATRPSDPPAVARRLLTLGALAGPLYVVVSLAQALAREGFDPTRHAWSMLANGDLGWIHVTNLIGSGALVLAGAAGLGRVLRPRTGPGVRWAPRLLAAYGAGLVAAGIFRADPGQGFPPGAPAEVTPTWHGMLHLVAAGVGFLALVVACLVLARRFRAGRQPGRAVFSLVTGAYFFASFAALSGSGGSSWAILVFTAAVILASGWLTMVFTYYRGGK